MLRVEQAGAEAFEAALALLERFFAEEQFHAQPAQLRARLPVFFEEGAAVFVAWQGEVPVGVATVSSGRGLELEHYAEIEDLYVQPEARGRGVAQALIAAARAWAREQGVVVIAVVVTPAGQATHNLEAFYTRQGFEPSGRTILFDWLAPDTG